MSVGHQLLSPRSCPIVEIQRQISDLVSVIWDFFKVWIYGWGGWGIMGKVREIISIVFVLFIESYTPPSHFNPSLLFSLPVFCWVFMDNDGKVEPKDSCPLMSCFKDMFKSSK